MDQDAAALVRGEVAVERSRTTTHRVIRFTVGKTHGRDENGNLWRLDKYLQALLPTIPRTVIRRWLEHGYCTSNGSVVGDRGKLKSGQQIELIAPLPTQHDDPGGSIAILHRGRGWLAVNKPPGLLAHEAGQIMTGTLLNQLQAWADQEGIAPDHVRLVNRIDRDTSGIVLATTDLATHQRLSAAMEARDLRKEYLALCYGVPDPAHGDWRDPIGDGPNTTIARHVHPDGQSAWTGYQTEASAHGFARIRLRLHTGRQHQIRIHAAHHGHPLVGDWVYGQGCTELSGQALHSALLELLDPDTDRPITITAPFPDTLAQLWSQLAAGVALSPRPLHDDERSKLGLGADTAGVRLPAWLSPAEFAALDRDLNP